MGKNSFSSAVAEMVGDFRERVMGGEAEAEAEGGDGEREENTTI